MYGTHFYHEGIRRTIILFADMFNNIPVARKSANGTLVNQRVVPIQYASRQKFLARLEERPDLTGERIQITLPRMSFEISGSLLYDSQRQLAASQFCQKVNAAGDAVKVFSPAPYSIPLELNIYSKNQDEALQVAEQILPYFRPSVTRRYKIVPGEDWTDEATFLFTGMTINDDYEGEFTDERTIVYTLSFEAQINLFGNVPDSDVIKTTIVSFIDSTTSETIQTTTNAVNPQSADENDAHTIDTSITYGFE
jgi:hypothetical protein